MKNFSFLSLALIAATLILNGCGQHDLAEDDIKWSDDNGGTLEINNTSAKDVILFYGQVPMPESILGGIRAGATKLFDVSGHVPDFGTGGYMIVRGITREQYNDNKYNLSAANVQFNAFATYRAGTKYRIEISENYMGDNAFRVTNMGNIGMELRKDGPNGEKISYLPALEVNQMIYTQTTDAVTLFPVYVFYNKSTQTINTVHATSMFESVMAQPSPAMGAGGIQSYLLPNDPSVSWATIIGDLEYPVAYVKVCNDVPNQSVYFRIGADNLKSQAGYDAIGSGRCDVFEVEASKGGVSRRLMILVYNSVQVFINEEGENGEDVRPTLINGHDYTVSIDLTSGNGQSSSNYTTTIVDEGPRDVKKLIDTLID